MQGMTGMEASFMLLCILLGSIHLAHVVASVVILRDLPFHIFFHAVLLGLWTVTAIAQADAAACHAPIAALRPFIVLSVALYTFLIYSTMAVYIGTAVYPPIYSKSAVWSAMMGAAFSLLACLTEVKRVSAHASANSSCSSIKMATTAVA
jgi:hypothetical protein